MLLEKMTELDKIAAVPPYLCIIWQHILKVFRDIKQNVFHLKLKSCHDVTEWYPLQYAFS